MWYGRVVKEDGIGQEETLNVTIADVGERFQLQSGEVVIGEFGSRAEAEGVAHWARYQLTAGTSLAELQKMLRGESSVEAADGAPATAPEAAGKAEAREPPAEEGTVDLAALIAGSVKTLKEALATGSFDHCLDAVLEAEQSGRARKSALQAVEARMQSAD